MVDTPLGAGPHAEPQRFVLVDAATGLPASAGTPFPTQEPSITKSVRTFAAGDADGAVGRYLRVTCTAAGNVVVKFADASTETVAVSVGYNLYPFAAVAVNTSGTTATATYANLS